jgi:hypothetical protein
MKAALELEGSAAWIALIVLLALAAPSASAQAAADPVVDALQHGGHVLVMRHARAPRAAPATTDAAPGNTTLERQLDATGRETAADMADGETLILQPDAERARVVGRIRIEEWPSDRGD